MNISASLKVSAIACMAAFCLSALTSKIAHAATVIRLDGSSTVYPISNATAEAFEKQQSDIDVEVAVSGTGGGFTRFCKGEIDIADASRSISLKEMAACKEHGIRFIEIPVAYDALTVVVNPKNEFVKSLTPAQLKKIWEPMAEGQIVSWRQVDPSFPDERLRLYGPGNNSGTFDYFTEAIVGKAKQSRTDYIASEDDYLIVRGVKRNVGAIGYFGYAYYLENQKKLKAVAIDNGKGGVLPSPESVTSSRYVPLSRPIFIYVASQAIERPEVHRFVSFYLKNAAKIVKAQHYVPLSAKVYQSNFKNIEARRFGSAFSGGEAHGKQIEEVLAMPPRE